MQSKVACRTHTPANRSQVLSEAGDGHVLRGVSGCVGVWVVVFP